ncbi:hypothetical protein [Cupriavidus sp. YAF13]|uniref:hypothetical protein n=1 Tax=Cupriavidus sp. YAF13 TaxID=3233075 RepID=UPI003F8E1AB2
MEEQRKGEYRGFEIYATAGWDPTAGFHVIAQRVQLTVQGALVYVPLNAVTSRRFVDLDSAFIASFTCIQEAIDKHIEGMGAR